jgi:ribonuclease HI
VARFFWEEVRLLTGVKVPWLNPLTWACDLIDLAVIPERNAAVILCGAWALWMARNRRRHGEVTAPVNIAAQWAIDTAFDLWQELHPVRITEISRNHQTWQVPDTGWVKANVDAAFWTENGSAASGIILRDQDGRCCGGTAIWYDYSLNALAAEATACHDGLFFAQQRGVRRLHLVTDCQVLVNLWLNRTNQKSEIAPLLQQMEDLSRSFEDFRFSFISRVCNKVAHECTRMVSRDNQVVEWLITPPGLRDVISTDCNPLLTLLFK